MENKNDKSETKFDWFIGRGPLMGVRTNVVDKLRYLNIPTMEINEILRVIQQMCESCNSVG